MLDDIFRESTFDDTSRSSYGHDSHATQRSGIDELIQQRSSILKTKLEVFALELFDRLRIRNQNLTSIADNQGKLEAMLEAIDRKANYHLREHREKGPLYDMLTKLEQEKRQEEVECWRDVADVIKDFLMVWEALEQSKARSVFLKT